MKIPYDTGTLSQEEKELISPLKYEYLDAHNKVVKSVALKQELDTLVLNASALAYQRAYIKAKKVRVDNERKRDEKGDQTNDWFFVQLKDLR